MSNLVTMVTEIGADLRRSSMTDDIKKAIAAGAAFMRPRRLWFNVKTFTFTEVASREYYDQDDSNNIPLVAKFDFVKRVDGQYEYELYPKDTDWIDAQNVGSSYRSQPQNYAYVRETIRLFPIPSTTKTISVNGILEAIDSGGAAGKQRLLRTNVLTLPDSYASIWFTDDVAYMALKSWAKGYLYTHKLGNAQTGAAMYAEANDLATEGKSQGQSQSGGDDMVASTSF